MKNLYARFVLWLIRPAVEKHDADIASESFERFRESLRNAPSIDLSGFSWRFSSASRDSSVRDETASKPPGECEDQARAERPRA